MAEENTDDIEDLEEAYKEFNKNTSEESSDDASDDKFKGFKSGEKLSVSTNPELEREHVDKEPEAKDPEPEAKEPEAKDPEPEAKDPEPEAKKREVPKNKTFDEDPSSIDSVMREALTDVDTVVVSMDDRTRYLKAVLNDVPVKLSISLCGGEITIQIRSRSTWEQSVLYAAVKKDQEEGLVADLSSVIIQLQKYGCALMLESVNEDPLEFLTLKQEDGLEKSISLLRDHMQKHIESLSMPKWTIFLNALRTFETKIARMGTECLNENFWKPAG